MSKKKTSSGQEVCSDIEINALKNMSFFFPSNVEPTPPCVHMSECVAYGVAGIKVSSPHDQKYVTIQVTKYPHVPSSLKEVVLYETCN